MVKNITLYDLNNNPEIYRYDDHFDKFLDIKPWLVINKTDWSWILKNIEETLIKESLTVLLSKYPFPYKGITFEEAKDEFIKLKELDTRRLISNDKWFSRSSINHKLSDIVLSGTNIGNKASDYFQEEWRMKTELENSPSQWRCWNTPKFMRTLINAFFSLKVPELNEVAVRRALTLRKGIASQFKPSIAKWLYDKYESENILDFSAGWGDRLCGFYASKKGKNFLGIDPNPNVHIGYNKQIELYSQLSGDSRKAKTIISPAEDLDLTYYNNKFDMVFTSPPYFNREKYTNDTTQSWMRYKSIEDWLENFLFKTISNIEPCIRTGGILSINISDVCSTSKGKKGKQWLEICNPMIDYVESLNKFELEEIVGYKMLKKIGGLKDNPDSIIGEDFIFGEPLFIWRKK